MSKANAFAYIAFWMVIPACMVLFTRVRPTRVVLLTLFGSTMFLPELLNFDFPSIPALDKETLPALTMLAGMLVFAKREVRAATGSRATNVLMCLALLATIGTVLTNQDALRYGPKLIKGQTWHDAMSFGLDTCLHVLIPFFLGRTLFRQLTDAKELLKIMVIAVLVYTPFILYELKMSPQLHTMVYGYRQHGFGQTKRGDAWRPQVFMHQGLALAMLICSGALAAGVLAKAKSRAVSWLAPGWAVAWTAVMLASLNSMGALVYGAVCLPLVLLMRPKGQLRFALVLAAFTMIYPYLRVTGVFPAKELVDWIAESNPIRAESLGFRFMHEEMLLDKLMLRPMFGWGGFARGHIWTPAGKNITTIDGAWIAIMSRGGVAEFVTLFGLLLLPIVMAYRAIDRVPRANQGLLAGVAVIASISALDLLPNGLFNGIPVFVAGALAGLSTGMPVENTGLASGAVLKRLQAALAAWAAEGPAKAPERAAASGQT